MLTAPSYEWFQMERTRDLVNLLPAMRHHLAARLQDLQRRLARLQLGDSLERLEAELELVRRICDALDELLETARRPPERFP